MKTNNRSVWVDHLRSAITVLVVAHHASLSYTTFASFDAEAYVRSTHPVVDSRRWFVLDVFQNFNDVFFMSLMFFISGLFVVRSIMAKSTAAFLKDRLLRLGIPFMAGATLLAGVTYFPPFYLAHHNGSLSAYILDFLTVEQWPAGPAWFIWVLLVFNILLLMMWRPTKGAVRWLGEKMQYLAQRPVLAVGVWIGVTWAAFTPLAFSVGHGTWTGWGPFDFQLSRIVLYGVYFVLGAGVGSTDFNQGIFGERSRLVAHWKIWVVMALLIYAVLVWASNFEGLRALVVQGAISEFCGWMVYFGLFAASCVCSCLAFLTAFRKLAGRPVRWWENLSENAYLIYLLHYTFVIWLQWWWMGAAWHAGIKFFLTFSISMALSWLTAYLLRKNNFIRRYM